MIENLPKEITLSHLEKFNFGNIEGSDDDLLFDSVCKISAIEEFLLGAKNIVLGEKGTGKTALFRLLKEGKLKFRSDDGCKRVLISIEDNFHYKSVKNKLLNMMKTDVGTDFKYQIIWEIFLFRKIIGEIEKLGGAMNDEINQAIKLSNKLFNPSGIETIFKSNITIGVKLYDTATSIMPDFYLTSDNKLNEASERKKEVLESIEIDLDLYKSAINDFLIQNKTKIIVLIDRLDEFVSKDSQKVQLSMLEALIAVQREYGRYVHVEIKIFLRDDLFKRLSFDSIGGYDKVISKKVDLTWTPDKVREFVAKRICCNYVSVFGMPHLMCSVDKESLEIDPLMDIHEDYVKPSLWDRYWRRLLKRVDSKRYKMKYPRKTNLNDDLSRQVVLSIFPDYVDFRNEDGKIHEMDFFMYLSDNFNLGTGKTIPRLILIFLDKLLLITKNYYMDNPDEMPISLRNNMCYEIFKRGFFERAYEEFKKEIHISFAKLNPDFEILINLFHEKMKNRYSFRAKELVSFPEIGSI